MTRRAKERRQERAQEKQRLADERARRAATLSARPTWQALLARIDGRVPSPSPSPPPSPSPSTSSAATAPRVLVADRLQWTSTRVPIAAAGVFHLPIKVDAPRATLRYDFTTEDYDISFGIQLIGADGLLRELYPLRRCESHLQAVRGDVTLVGPGLVMLLWDNSFSWLNVKHLAYSVQLEQDFGEEMDEPEATAPAHKDGHVEPPPTSSDRIAMALRERVRRQEQQREQASKLEQVTHQIRSQEQHIDFIDHQIIELERQREEAIAKKEQTERERAVVEDVIETLAWEIDALTWRSISSDIVDAILEYCDDRDLMAWALTSRRWHNVVAEFRQLSAAEDGTMTDTDNSAEVRTGEVIAA